MSGINIGSRLKITVYNLLGLFGRFFPEDTSLRDEGVEQGSNTMGNMPGANGVSENLSGNKVGKGPDAVEMYTQKRVKAMVHGPAGRAGIRPQGYVEDQTRDNVSVMPYGKGDISGNGCGIIAAYNTLLRLGYAPDFSDKISWFEKHGEAWYGKAGVTPKSLLRHLRDEGLHVETTFDFSASSLHKREMENDAHILLFHPKKDMIHMHYVMIAREGAADKIVNTAAGATADKEANAANTAAGATANKEANAADKTAGHYVVHNALYPYKQTDKLEECIFSLCGGRCHPVMLYSIRKMPFCDAI